MIDMVRAGEFVGGVLARCGAGPAPDAAFRKDLDFRLRRYVSGLWHHGQCIWQPLRNTVVRIPGLSWTEKRWIWVITPLVIVPPLERSGLPVAEGATRPRPART